jgi:phospholipid/cholesterol/gamma-HCH transport system permease protein
MNWIEAIGGRTLDVLAAWGRGARFFVNLMRVLPKALRRPRLVVDQLHAIGNRSLTIVLASGLSVGFVLALQMYNTLTNFGAVEALGLAVNLTLVRELGPVVTALLFAGRAGTSLTAEIGLMKAGEQIAAMELMAIDPRTRILGPRFLAGIIAMPLLAAMFSAIGILGAWLVAVGLIGIDSGNFWSTQQNGVDVWRDVGNGMVKSAVFGVICTFVALYQGFEAKATPEGVSAATTRTVVMSSLAVLAADFLLTALMFSSD